MPERTQWDDDVDRAIDLLISEDTEAFAMTAVKSEESGDGGTYLLNADKEGSDAILLAIFTMVEEIRRRSVANETPLSPEQILYAAAGVAEERGYLGSDREFIE